jgi:R67 dihydrofolate reductase
MSSTPDPLKACPFDNGEAELCSNRGTITEGPFYWVLCRKCHACPGTFKTPEEAVEAWNTRTPDPLPSVVSEPMIEAALDDLIARRPSPSDRTEWGEGVVAGIEMARHEIRHIVRSATPEDGQPQQGESVGASASPQPVEDAAARMLLPFLSEDMTFARARELVAEILAQDKSAEDGRVERAFKLGDRVTKVKGSSWTGKVVGFYSTALTPEGYAVESENEPGSVQIYPRAALQGTTV